MQNQKGDNITEIIINNSNIQWTYYQTVYYYIRLGYSLPLCANMILVKCFQFEILFVNHTGAVFHTELKLSNITT